MAQIVLENISKTIKRNTVLNNISLEMNSGSVIGFKGINGSGKTMLMRIITGLIRPTEGRVFIDGKQLHKDISFPPSIGVLLENPAFIDAYSGKENLRLLSTIKHIATNEDINEILDFVGLSDAKEKKYKKYSLGMKQRLGIAAAIMESPDLILLDEPTNSLDADGVEMVKRIVKEEKRRGATVVISCHDAEILNELSDMIYVIKEGRITDFIEKG